MSLPQFFPLYSPAAGPSGSLSHIGLLLKETVVPVRWEVFSENGQMADFAKDAADRPLGNPQLLPDLLC